MRHKVIAIFNHLNRLIGLRKQKNNQSVRFYDYLIPPSISLVFNIVAKYDSFSKDVISYFQVYIYDNVVEKKTMGFSINSAGGMLVEDEFDIGENPQEKYVNELYTYYFPSQPVAQQPISVMEIESIPPNSSPFHYDLSRMGVHIGGDWTIMYNSNDSKGIDRVVLVNTKTGRRFDLDLFEAEKPIATLESEKLLEE